MDPAELVEEMRCVGVTEARNITQNRNGTKIKTAAIILTFAKAILPKSINAGYMHIKVEPYIPNPLRCFTCQGLGHHQSTCKRSKICAKCSKPDHGTDACTSPVHCINCDGGHPAYASSCPKWVKEKEICRIKVTHGVTFPEARRMASPETSESTNRISYSAMAHPSIPKSTKSVSTQTDIINCKCQPIQTNQKLNNNTTKTNSTRPTAIQTEIDMSIEPECSTKNIENSAEESEEGWSVVGRSRASSLSPKKGPTKLLTQRGSAGEPPDKQFRSSVSPNSRKHGKGGKGKGSTKPPFNPAPILAP
jgi:hypothetical protein